jgi:hypothetical protein
MTAADSDIAAVGVDRSRRDYPGGAWFGDAVVVVLFGETVVVVLFGDVVVVVLFGDVVDVVVALALPALTLPALVWPLADGVCA